MAKKDGPFALNTTFIIPLFQVVHNSSFILEYAIVILRFVILPLVFRILLFSSLDEIQKIYPNAKLLAGKEIYGNQRQTVLSGLIFMHRIILRRRPDERNIDGDIYHSAPHYPWVYCLVA